MEASLAADEFQPQVLDTIATQPATVMAEWGEGTDHIDSVVPDDQNPADLTPEDTL